MGIFAHVQGHSFTFGCGVLLVIHWLEFRDRPAPTRRDGDHGPHPNITGSTNIPLLGRATQHPAAVGVQPSPRCVARQRLPHIGLGQAELSGDLRWLDTALKAARTFIFPGAK
jgi:hypothetical protein